MPSKRRKTPRQVADALGVSHIAVRAWCREGMPHDRAGVRYLIDPAEAKRWARKHKNPAPHQNATRANRARKAKGDASTPRGSRTRETKATVDLRAARARAELHELKAAQLREALVPRERTEQALAELAFAVRQQMRGLPELVARELAKLVDHREVADRLLDAIDATLHAILDHLEEGLED